MRPGSLRSVPVAAPSVQGKPCKARNGRWTGRPHRESPRASVSASPVTIYHNACLKTQSDRLLGKVAVMQCLHDRLDGAVAAAYRWPADLSDEQHVARLVALNRARRQEESNGHILWLRPEYQNPANTSVSTQISVELDEGAD